MDRAVPFRGLCVWFLVGHRAPGGLLRLDRRVWPPGRRPPLPLEHARGAANGTSLGVGVGRDLG